MSGRILIVDDIPANAKLLEARLTVEYYDVQYVDNGPAAIEICQQGGCDLVLLDVMMPGMDGFEVSRRLKADPTTVHIPIVLVTALDQISDRVEGLRAGADDFLTKPVSEVALLARVKSLMRLKQLTDELRLRANTTQDLQMEQFLQEANRTGGEGSRVLLVDDRASSQQRLERALRKSKFETVIEEDPQQALFVANEQSFDLILVSLTLKDFDGLRLCSQIRSLEGTRNLPILLIAEEGQDGLLMRGLELGVNDYLTRPVDLNELQARCITQVRRKKYNDYLRNSVQTTMELAVKDPLTGLHNRRYLEAHLANHLKKARAEGGELSLLVLDIDFFKKVNDTYGHDGGDAILVEFARRIEDNVRRIDLPCRFGGEEFVVVMPETDQDLAYAVADRIREMVAAKPFYISAQDRHADVTTSIGIACLNGSEDSAEAMFKRADEALYEAKQNGRNQVITKLAA